MSRTEPRTIVVKVGTSSLTGGGGRLDGRFIGRLVSQICHLLTDGRRLVLVSSGAIRAGLDRLRRERARTVPQKQAAAAVGQVMLMERYQRLFENRGVLVGQLLLTRNSITDRERFVNAQNTIRELFALGAVPVVNENDTVAVHEIEFGDNDTLAVHVAMLADADLIIMLSDVEGFILPGKDEPEREVARITPRLLKCAGGPGSTGGTGGMAAKLEAARIAMRAGIPMVLAHARTARVLERVVAGERLGTRFLANHRLSGRKRWIAFGKKVTGRVTINAGALESLLHRGRSLLAVGVVGADGDFRRGDLISILDEKGKERARGVTNYSCEEIRRIAGKRSNQIESILGYKHFDEVVHRDQLIIDLE